MKVQRILHVVVSMDPKLGGVCQAVRSLIKGFEGTDVANEVVSLDISDAPYTKMDRFRIHAIGPGSGPWSYSDKLIPWLYANLQRFDVVVLHGLWLYPNYAVHKLIRRYRTAQIQEHIPKVFIMPHGMLDPYFQKAAGRRLKSIRNSVYWKLIEGDVVNKAEGVLFTCEEELNLARGTFSPYNPKREIVVGLGVENPPPFTADMKDHFFKKFNTLQNRPYLLFLSRIHEKKGIDLLIKSYAEIWRRRTASEKEIDASAICMGKEKPGLKNFYTKLPFLVIAGPGLDTPYGRSMQQLAAGSAAPEGSILFPGMLSGDAKWGAFYGCEAFLLPSHQENFGIAVVEALGCGKPVLISNQVNIWREIEAEGGGMIAEDNYEGTVKVLETFLNLPEEKKQMIGNNARLCFEKKFSIGANARKFHSAL